MNPNVLDALERQVADQERRLKLGEAALIFAGAKLAALEPMIARVAPRADDQLVAIEVQLIAIGDRLTALEQKG